MYNNIKQEIELEEIKSMREVLKDMIKKTSVTYVVKLAIDVGYEVSTELFHEYNNILKESDKLSIAIQGKDEK